MSITVTGILPDPFGDPAGNVEFRVITKTNINSVQTSIAKHTTNALGEYSFELLNNTYSLYVKVDDTFEHIIDCIVEDSTPTPITIPELIRYTSPVELAEIGDDTVLWDNLYSAIQSDVETIYQESVTQLRDGDVYSSRSKHLWTDNGSMSDQVDTLSTGSSTVTKRPVVYSDDSGNQSAQDTTSVSVDIGSASTELDIRSDGTGSTKTEVTTESGHILNQTTLSNLTLVGSEAATLNGNGTSKDLEVTETSSTLVEALDHSTETYTVEMVDSGSIEHGYRDDNQVEIADVPKVEKISSVSLVGGIHDISLIDKLLARINEMDEAIVELQKELIVGTKTTSITQSNTGLATSTDIVTDTYSVKDEEGNTTFEVDTVNNKVTLSGTLTLEHAEDFKGEDGSTIFQVFQYSSNNADWHDSFIDGDIYRRWNTSTDGYVDPIEWSEGVLLIAEDGADGDTLYIQYMYSSDYINWHSDFTDGDIWRRERTIENNTAITAWTDGARIKGTDGDNGEITKIVYQYSVDGLTVWHSNFTTGDHYRRERYEYFHTAEDMENNESYSVTYWDINSDVLLLNSEKIYNSLDEETNWSDPAKMVPVPGEDYPTDIEGINGLHGSGSYIIYVATDAIATGYTSAERDSHILALSGRDAQAGDILSYYGDETVADDDQFSYQYIRNDTVWEAFLLQINGSAIINGTLAAEALIADTIAGVTLDISGHITAKSLSFIEDDGTPTDIPKTISNNNILDKSISTEAGANILPIEFDLETSHDIPIRVAGDAEYSFITTAEGEAIVYHIEPDEAFPDRSYLNGFEFRNENYENNVEIFPNTAYIVSAWVYMFAQGNNNMDLTMYFNTQTNPVLSETFTLPLETWTRISFVADLTAYNHSYAYIRMHKDYAGDVYINRIMIERQINGATEPSTYVVGGLVKSAATVAIEATLDEAVTTAGTNANNADKTDGSVGGWFLDNDYIHSGDTAYTGDSYTVSGMTLNKRGSLHSKNFCIDSAGNAYFKGNGEFTGVVTASSGSFSGAVYASSGSFSGTVNANAGTFNNVTINANCTVLGTISANQINGDIGSGIYREFGYVFNSTTVAAEVLHFTVDNSTSGRDTLITVTGISVVAISRGDSVLELREGSSSGTVRASQILRLAGGVIPTLAYVLTQRSAVFYVTVRNVNVAGSAAIGAGAATITKLRIDGTIT